MIGAGAPPRCCATPPAIRSRSGPFNGQVFFHPAAGSNGTLHRRVFNGPSVFNMDFALFKKTQITEGQSVEVRMEASNFLNISVSKILEIARPNCGNFLAAD